MSLVFPVAPSQMSGDEFVCCFGTVYEHTPWIAAGAWRAGINTGHDTVDGLATALAGTLEQADHDQKLALIRAHPDLAGRAAVGGQLTEASNTEQASAGLDQCTPEEFQRFQNNNEAYKTKFGFPFVMAVKGGDRHTILAAFEERLHNDPETEFQRALQEIHRIAALRLAEIAHEQAKLL